MYTHMLTKRTNVLFDEELWQLLVAYAHKRQTSVGELVRTAVRKVYVSDTRQERIARACESILKHRPAPFKGRIDYKELINYGRKW